MQSVHLLREDAVVSLHRKVAEHFSCLVGLADDTMGRPAYGGGDKIIIEACAATAPLLLLLYCTRSVRVLLNRCAGMHERRVRLEQKTALGSGSRLLTDGGVTRYALGESSELAMSEQWASDRAAAPDARAAARHE